MLNFFASSAAKKSKVLGKTQEEPLEVKTTPQKQHPHRIDKKSPISFKLTEQEISVDDGQDMQKSLI